MSEPMARPGAGPTRAPEPARDGVAVIMPVARDGATFRRALAATAALRPAPEEFIVVSDGPAPDAAAAARAAGARVVLLDVPRGPAAARNAGARAAGAPILLFVDADVVVPPDLVARARAALAGAGVAAVVGCYDDHPPEPGFFSQYKNLAHRYVHLTAQPEASTFWGACGAVRRAAFLAVGGFDERFRRPSVEDIDLGYRLKAAGYRIRFTPELGVTHLKRWTLVSLIRSDVFDRAVPWTWLLLRERRIANDLNLTRASRAAAAAAWVAAGSAAAAWVDPRLLAAAVAAFAAGAWLDRGLLRFLAARRGPGFAARAALWHPVYYLYSTLAFAAAVAGYPVSGRRLTARGVATPEPAAGRRRDVA